MAFDLAKLRVPPGSLIVYAGLVVSLVYVMGQITERLIAFDLRLQNVEQTTHSITPQADARLRVIERENTIQDRDLAEFKTDIVKRLDQMDSKLDLIYRAQAGHR